MAAPQKVDDRRPTSPTGALQALQDAEVDVREVQAVLPPIDANDPVEVLYVNSFGKPFAALVHLDGTVEPGKLPGW